MGEVFHLSVNGIDYSPVTPNTFRQDMKGYGEMMTMPRDYEKVEEVCRRLRRMRKMGRRVYRLRLQGADRRFFVAVHVADGDDKELLVLDLLIEGKTMLLAAAVIDVSRQRAHHVKATLVRKLAWSMYDRQEAA